MEINRSSPETINRTSFFSVKSDMSNQKANLNKEDVTQIPRKSSNKEGLHDFNPSKNYEPVLLKENMSSEEKSSKLESIQSCYDNAIKVNTGIPSKPKITPVIHYGRKIRYIIYSIFMITNLVINMDHGTIPAATEEIKIDLDINADLLGVFGSLVYFGALIGSINRKIMLVVCLLLISVLLFTFVLIPNLYFLMLNRVFIGIFQAYIVIYFPLWVDQFGPKNSKTILMTFLQVGVPLGVVLGYILTGLIKSYFNWKYAFVIQGITTVILMIIILFIPSMYFTSTYHNIKTDKKREKEARYEESEKEYSVFNRSESVYHDAHNPEERLSYKRKQSQSFCSHLKQLIKHKLFIVCNLSISTLLFVVTAIQFWVTDYLKIVLQIPEQYIFISFAVNCVTAPTLGVIFGGMVIQYIGGYESKYSLLICLGFAIVASGFGVCLPFLDNLIYFDIFLWGLLFFGGAMMPNMAGIIISSLPTHLKATGNSLTSLISNLFGYIPAPFVYGMLFKNYEKTYPKLAFTVVMYYPTLGVLFIGIATIIRFRVFRRQEAEEELNAIEENIKRDSRKFSDINRRSRIGGINAMLFGNYTDLNSLDMIDKEDHERVTKTSKKKSMLAEKLSENTIKENDSDSDCNSQYSNTFQLDIQEGKNPKSFDTSVIMNDTHNKITDLESVDAETRKTSRSLIENKHDNFERKKTSNSKLEKKKEQHDVNIIGINQNNITTEVIQNNIKDNSDEKIEKEEIILKTQNEDNEKDNQLNN